MNRLFFLLSLAVVFTTCKDFPENKRPNIIVILVDDMGFSDIGCFGAEIIQTPNLDKLAESGIIFSQFYNSARCCPSRASLLTGQYPQSAGMGSMTDQNIAIKSYQGYFPADVAVIPQVLKQKGYRSYISGKWHVGDEVNHYPINYGFDRCLALIQGASSYFEDVPYRNDKWPWGSTDNFHMNDNVRFDYPNGTYSTDLYTDYAIKYINESDSLNAPFFLYLSYTAPHWPLHALPEDIRKYKGKFDIGWDELRNLRYENLVELGIIDPSSPLSHREAGFEEWESLPDKRKDAIIKKMEVYAAMIDRVDQNIGRLIEYLKDVDKYDNTIVMFLSDNGGCRAEEVSYLSDYFSNEAEVGSPESFTAYGRGWANASNTPFRYYKAQVHEGGIASPFILSYPKRIFKGNSISDTPAHLIDIMPTILEAAGSEYPEKINNNSIVNLEGKNLFDIAYGDSSERVIGIEHHGNAALRKGKWKLVKLRDGNWELYDLSVDRTEMNNLIDQVDEEVLNSLFEDYRNWSSKVKAYPYDVVKSRSYIKN